MLDPAIFRFIRRSFLSCPFITEATASLRNSERVAARIYLIFRIVLTLASNVPAVSITSCAPRSENFKP